MVLLPRSFHHKLIDMKLTYDNLQESTVFPPCIDSIKAPNKFDVSCACSLHWAAKDRSYQRRDLSSQNCGWKPCPALLRVKEDLGVCCNP